MAVSHSGVWNDRNMLKKLLVSGVLVAGSLGLTMTRSGANGHGANPAPSAVCAADCTVTVPYSKYPRYFWVAPARVTSITFDVRGADGGSSQTDCPSPCLINAGGRGGRITGTLAVTPGKTYYFLIGGSGQNFAGPQGARPKGGYNGGGGGTINYPGDFPGMGGGASSIQTTRTVRIQKDQVSELLVVAGGGGGAGYRAAGGQGGGQNGGDGGLGFASSGGGGSQVQGGSAGGTAQAGSFDKGGRGVGILSGGGGGGGGFYGGGGGAGGGGGGGSSYADRTVATVATNEQGFVDSTRNGAIIISWPNMNT